MQGKYFKFNSTGARIAFGSVGSDNIAIAGMIGDSVIYINAARGDQTESYTILDTGEVVSRKERLFRYITLYELGEYFVEVELEDIGQPLNFDNKAKLGDILVFRDDRARRMYSSRASVNKKVSDFMTGPVVVTGLSDGKNVSTIKRISDGETIEMVGPMVLISGTEMEYFFRIGRRPYHEKVSVNQEATESSDWLVLEDGEVVRRTLTLEEAKEYAMDIASDGCRVTIAQEKLVVKTTEVIDYKHEIVAL